MGMLLMGSVTRPDEGPPLGVLYEGHCSQDKQVKRSEWRAQRLTEWVQELTEGEEAESVKYVSVRKKKLGRELAWGDVESGIFFSLPLWEMFQHICS